MEHIRVIGVLLIACALQTSVNAIWCSTCSGVGPCQSSVESEDCPWQYKSCYQYIDNDNKVYRRGCLSGDCADRSDYTVGDTDCRTCTTGDRCNDDVLPPNNAWFAERRRLYGTYGYSFRDVWNDDENQQQHYNSGGGSNNGYDPNDPNKKQGGGGSQYKSASTHTLNAVTVFSVFAVLCVTAALHH